MAFYTDRQVIIQDTNLQTFTGMFGPVFLDLVHIPLFSYSGKIVEARKRTFLISQNCIYPTLHPILLHIIG